MSCTDTWRPATANGSLWWCSAPCSAATRRGTTPSPKCCRKVSRRSPIAGRYDGPTAPTRSSAWVAGPDSPDDTERERLIRVMVPELVAAGATVVREEYYGDVFGHVLMADPEGNEFCVT